MRRRLGQRIVPASGWGCVGGDEMEVRAWLVRSSSAESNAQLLFVQKRRDMSSPEACLSVRLACVVLRGGGLPFLLFVIPIDGVVFLVVQVVGLLLICRCIVLVLVFVRGSEEWSLILLWGVRLGLGASDGGIGAH